MSKRKTSAGTYLYNKTLAEYTDGFRARAEPDREIGIEIEVEGTDLPRGRMQGWSIHEDGSLRGESAEYVFNGPAKRTEIEERLAVFKKAIERSKINQSYRTSVHVHVNQQDVKIKDIISQILLYTIWEDVLGALCGNERVGNLFALRAKDAEFYLERLHRSVAEDYYNLLNVQELRYTAVNPMSLFSHGTLEYRSMRGTTDTELIAQWADVLLAIKDAAIDVFTDPRHIVQEISTRGPDDWARMIFKERHLDLFQKGWQEQILEGVRLVQHIAHANPNQWEATPDKKERVVKPPTYGRYTTVNIVADDPGLAALRTTTIADLQRPTIRLDNLFMQVEAAEPGWAAQEEER